MYPCRYLRRFSKFAFVGGSGVVVNVGLLHLFTEVCHWDYRIASLFAIECAIINNFAWNYRWTWKDRQAATTRGAAGMLLKFNCSSGFVALAVNWVTLVLLTSVAGIYYQLSNIIGIGLGTTANFLLSHFWAFVPPSPAAKAEDAGE